MVLAYRFFSNVHSYVLIQEGDMMIEPSIGSVQTSKTENVRSKQNAVKNKKNLWDFGEVPYEIDMTVGFGGILIARIEAAMRHWENYTCIIFVKRNAVEHEDIQFTNNDSLCNCCSQIGKAGGGQDILVNGCDEVGELGHVIGFKHEHQDDYITEIIITEIIIRAMTTISMSHCAENWSA